MRTAGRALAALTLLLALLAACTIAPRRTAPAPAPSPSTIAEVPHVIRLANGLKIVHRRNTTNRIVAVHLLCRPGAVADPADRLGRAALLARVLTKGTGKRSSDEIAQTLEGMGARLGASAGHDFAGVSLQCVRDDLGRAFEVFADIVRHPAFPLEEIRTEKARMQADLRMREDQSSSATIKRFRGALFLPHPYGRPADGEPATVDALGQVDLVAAHRETFRPDRMVISIVGDLTEQEAVDLVSKYFGDMAPASDPLFNIGRTFTPGGTRTEYSRDVEQGFVALGTIGCAIDDPDAPALEVATAILGEGMSSRLFTELRDKRGLAYMVGAQTGEMLEAGYVLAYIGTSPATIDASLDGLWEQMELMRDEPVTAEELSRAQAYLIGQYLRQHESNAQQANHLAYWEATGMGIEFDARYPDLVRAVTVRDVMRVANRYYNDPTVVILRPEKTGAPTATP